MDPNVLAESGEDLAWGELTKASDDALSAYEGLAAGT